MENQDINRHLATEGRCLVECPKLCSYYTCRYNLIEPGTAGELINTKLDSCCLRLAFVSSYTLEEIGAIMNLTRERIRQIEQKAYCHLGRLLERLGIEIGPDLRKMIHKEEKRRTDHRYYIKSHSQSDPRLRKNKKPDHRLTAHVGTKHLLTMTDKGKHFCKTCRLSIVPPTPMEEKRFIRKHGISVRRYLIKLSKIGVLMKRSGKKVSKNAKN